MDLHPLIVHFPIALLTLYTFCELARFKKLRDNQSWLFFKSALVVLGVLGAGAALGTGETARHINHPTRELVSAHERFAQITTFLFALLAANYALIFLERILASRTSDFFVGILRTVSRIRIVIFSAPAVIVVALMGFAALVATGALGGLMVYGPTADPLTSFFNSIFGPR